MKKICTFIILIYSLIPAFAQVITIGTGTSISAFSPQNHNTAYSVTEILYFQSEINTSGFITALAFEKHDGTVLDSIQNVKIFLTHTNATSYTPTIFDTTGANYVEVFSGSFPNNALSGWMEVQLQTPFAYNNINNLQVLFLKTNSLPTYTPANGGARYRYSIPGGDRVRRYNSNTPYQLGVTSLTTTNFISNIRLTFAPPGPPDCPVLVSPPDNSLQICPEDPIFSWAIAGGSPATDFEFYLGTDGGGATLPTNVINGTLTGNVLNYQYSGTLAANTTYYWSAVSLNASGTATGCQIYSFTTGNLPPSVSVASVPDPVQCYGDTASVAVFALGGTPPYTYLWSTGQTTSSVLLGGGAYSVTVTDSILCQITQFLGISEPPAIISNLASTPDSTGSANCSGTVSANPTGGIPPFTVTWSSGSTTNLCAGWCIATITDANGCTETDSVFVDFGSGMNELNSPEISVYPNPVKDLIILDSENKEIGAVKIYDITGRILNYRYIPEKISSLKISELSSGIYFLEIKNQRIKFVKQ